MKAGHCVDCAADLPRQVTGRPRLRCAKCQHAKKTAVARARWRRLHPGAKPRGVEPRTDVEPGLPTRPTTFAAVVSLQQRPVLHKRGWDWLQRWARETESLVVDLDFAIGQLTGRRDHMKKAQLLLLELDQRVTALRRREGEHEVSA